MIKKEAIIIRCIVHHAAKTTGKKQVAVKTARTGQRLATQRRTRRRGVRFEEEESSEESDEKYVQLFLVAVDDYCVKLLSLSFDPSEITALPKRVASAR